MWRLLSDSTYFFVKKNTNGYFESDDEEEAALTMTTTTTREEDGNEINALKKKKLKLMKNFNCSAKIYLQNYEKNSVNSLNIIHSSDEIFFLTKQMRNSDEEYITKLYNILWKGNSLSKLNEFFEKKTYQSALVVNFKYYPAPVITNAAYVEFVNFLKVLPNSFNPSKHNMYKLFEKNFNTFLYLGYANEDVHFVHMSVFQSAYQQYMAFIELFKGTTLENTEEADNTDDRLSHPSGGGVDNGKENTNSNNKDYVSLKNTYLKHQKLFTELRPRLAGIGF